MIEIRRIAEDEGDSVALLWDRMCQEAPGGGPLTPRGRRNLARLLGMSSWHQHAFCMVATEGDTIVGFINGRIDIEDGLLPGISGHLESLYVLRRVTHPRSHGARPRSCIAHPRSEVPHPASTRVDKRGRSSVGERG